MMYKIIKNNKIFLSQQIHTEATRVAKKHGLKLEIKPTEYEFTGKYDDKNVPQYEPIYELNEPQIRHILTVFEGVLGENPFYFHTISFREDEIVLIDNLEQPWFLSYNKDMGYDYANLQKALARPKSQAEALYLRWFPFKNRPSEEQVLVELLEILEKTK